MTVAAEESERLAELRASARGWHGVQLAALGFIGLCGVIQSGDASVPRSLQVLAGILVLIAFALACAGIVLVGKAAWPLYRGDRHAGSVAAVSSQLTRGLALTFLSIAALALATATSWWPTERAGAAGAATVRVQTSDGRSACGTLAESPQPGALRVVADARPLDVALSSVAGLAPVAGC